MLLVFSYVKWVMEAVCQKYNNIVPCSCEKKFCSIGWIGIPNFYGFGSGMVSGERLRFLVMSRLGSDIEKFFQSGERPLPFTTALNIAIQIIDSLGNTNNASFSPSVQFKLTLLAGKQKKTRLKSV